VKTHGKKTPKPKTTKQKKNPSIEERRSKREYGDGAIYLKLRARLKLVRVLNFWTGERSGASERGKGTASVMDAFGETPALAIKREG